MKLYYRISDNSYKKQKLPGATKEVCLMNFCKAFSSVIFKNIQNFPIKIIADKCHRTTVKMIDDTALPYILSESGNAGSLFSTINLALEECSDDELVYFSEDDYLHLGSAPKLLEEGIKRADYVTLYDHPDKYTRHYEGGEISKVIKTASSHWRYTASTCMTFGVKIKTLKEDLKIWKEFTDGEHPHDHFIFTKLMEENRRRLAVCIPGVACHTDLTFSGAMSHVLMESWAIDLMISELESQLNSEDKDFLQLKAAMLNNKYGWERLIALDALKSKF